MLNRVIRRFWNDHRGYVIALTLIAMPLLLGFALLVVDVGRSSNLHTDLQNAVDAMALAAARELDGRDDAIERAEKAVAQLVNKAAFGGGGTGMSLGSNITVSFAQGNRDKCNEPVASTVKVLFFSEIPPDDDTPLDCSDAIWDSNAASYAWVRAKPQAMTTVFPIVRFVPDTDPDTMKPDTVERSTINVSAEAVAVYRASACDVTPIYICNPFENPNGGNAEEAAKLLHSNFADGNLYGRQIEFHNDNTGTTPPGPGNFGFLAVGDNGANALSEALAIGKPGMCYKQNDLTTEPGIMKGPVENGVNTRFGLYGGSFGNNDKNPLYRPAPNVRMAQDQGGNKCKSYSQVTDAYDAVPLGYGATMQNLPGGGGKIAIGNNWKLNLYWDISHSGQKPSPLKSDPNYVPPAAPASTITAYSSSYPGGLTPAGVQPSAFDVYNYEIGNPSLLADKAPNGETGVSQCYQNYNLADYPDSTYGNRREIFAAIINCADQKLQGRQEDVKAVAFARMFLVQPVLTVNSESRMVLETVDITGEGGRGTLDEFLREEAELVR